MLRSWRSGGARRAWRRGRSPWCWGRRRSRCNWSRIWGCCATRPGRCLWPRRKPPPRRDASRRTKMSASTWVSPTMPSGCGLPCARRGPRRQNGSSGCGTCASRKSTGTWCGRASPSSMRRTAIASSAGGARSPSCIRPWRSNWRRAKPRKSFSACGPRCRCGFRWRSMRPKPTPRRWTATGCSSCFASAHSRCCARWASCSPCSRGTGAIWSMRAASPA